ncbi:MAG: hypothetical protein ICV83_22235, partial [Cytophagales bacterium]|nr:hypothetical protein [Cytophagales bacterium]
MNFPGPAQFQEGGNHARVHKKVNTVVCKGLPLSLKAIRTVAATPWLAPRLGWQHQPYSNAMNYFHSMVERMLSQAGKEVSRQHFLHLAGKGLAAGTLSGLASACQVGRRYPANPSTTYTASDGVKVPSSTPYSPPAKVPDKPGEAVELEPWKSKADRESAPAKLPLPPDQRVGYA